MVTGPGCGVLLLRYSLDVNAATLGGYAWMFQTNCSEFSFISFTMGVLVWYLV